jgi:hypothetical protein
MTRKELVEDLVMMTGYSVADFKVYNYDQLLELWYKSGFEY